MAGDYTNMLIGLDLGTSGVAVAVLKAGHGVVWELLGLGYSPALGVAQGLVSQADEAAVAIRSAVKEAELSSGVSINEVLAAINMPGMVASDSGARLRLEAGRKVTRRDLTRLRRDLSASILPANHKVIQLINVRYYLDGEFVAEPLGLTGRSIKSEALVVAAPDGPIKALQECLNLAGLKIKRTVAGPLAVAGAVLTGVERELGVVCVDVGASLTKVAYINHNRLIKLKIFPAGSGHITSDLAVGLHTRFQVAEAIKIKYGLECKEDYIETAAYTGRNEQTLAGSLLNQIVTSRLEELLNFIKQFISTLQLPTYPPGGVVITGGGARLAGLQEFAASYLALPVRVDTGEVLLKAVPDEKAYRYITAIGLGLWGLGQKPLTRRVEGHAKRGLLGRIKKWL